MQVWWVGSKVSTQVCGFVGSEKTALRACGAVCSDAQQGSSLIVSWELSLVEFLSHRACRSCFKEPLALEGTSGDHLEPT